MTQLKTLDADYEAVEDSDSILATAAANVAVNAANASSTGIWLLYGAIAWFTGTTQVNTAQLVISKGTGGDIAAAESKVADDGVSILFPRPLRIDFTAGADTIEADLEAGGIAVVGHVKLLLQRIDD